MKRIFSVLFVLFLICFLAGCDKKKYYEETQSLFVTSGELYSNDGNDGIILDGIISFTDLDINRKKISEYGFIYSYDEKNNLDVDKNGEFSSNNVSIDDCDKQNHVSIVLPIEETNYNKTLYFRMYIKYSDKDGIDQYALSYSVGDCNLYELSTKDSCEFAKKVREFVEKNK